MPPPTTATHLLRSDVDINTIRAWLSQASINAANIHAEADLEIKTEVRGLRAVKGARPSRSDLVFSLALIWPAVM